VYDAKIWNILEDVKKHIHVFELKKNHIHAWYKYPNNWVSKIWNTLQGFLFG